MSLSLAPAVVLGHVRVTGNANPRRLRFVVSIGNPNRCATLKAPDTSILPVFCYALYGGNYFSAGKLVLHSTVSDVYSVTSTTRLLDPRSHT